MVAMPRTGLQGGVVSVQSWDLRLLCLMKGGIAQVYAISERRRAENGVSQQQTVARGLFLPQNFAPVVNSDE